MKKIEVFNGSEWLEQEPQHGDKFRELINGKVVRESYWADTVSPHIGTMTLTIDGDSKQRHVALVNTPNTYRIECSVPVTDSFAVPLEGLLGAKGKTVLFEFVDGVAERAITFAESGEWEVTEAQINKHLPTGQHFKFAGINISVAE